MKIFVATNKSQSARDSDFCHTEEGEILTFAVECERDEEDPDGECGCRRSLLGIDSSGATTTFTVAELPMKSAEYKKEVVAYFADKGWFDLSNEQTVEMFTNDADILIEAADRFPVGVVLEKRGDTIQMRQPVQQSGAFMVARARNLSRLSKAVW